MRKKIFFSLFFLVNFSYCFEVLWKIELDEWAHMGIIHNGIAYNQWTGGSLSAVDIKSGQLLKRVDNVADATAPFIVGNKIYSFNGYSALYEIDLNTFDITRTIYIRDALYTENIPYDKETGYFYAKQAKDWKGRVSAIRLSDGKVMWSFPQNYEGGFDGCQAPLLAGDSVFLQSQNSYWSGKAYLYRINKFNGQLIWACELGPATNTSGGLNRGGYNNPIYDKDHDVIYVSESYNKDATTGLKGNCSVYAIKRIDGTKLWRIDISSYNIESTLSYYDGILYIPVHNDRGTGKYRAVNVIDGSTIWEKDGFFGEDCWSATSVCEKYLYRTAHGDNTSKLIIQDRKTGELVWSVDADGAHGNCTNPVQSEGIVVLGSTKYLWGLKVSSGEPVDSVWHGENACGYNPGAIIWNSTTTTPVRIFVFSNPISLPADGMSTSTITAMLYDIENNLVVNFDRIINFSLTGPGEFIGNNQVITQQGKAKIIYKAGLEPGNILITATSEGLNEGSTDIVVYSTGVQHPFPQLCDILNDIKLDFGETEIGEIKSMYFQIGNCGNSTIFGTAKTNREWIKISPEYFEIPEGEQIIFTATVDNVILNMREGEFSGLIIIESNAGNASISVKLRASCVLVKPNPYNPEKGLLTFYGNGVVAKKTRIKIYSLSGEIIWENSDRNKFYDNEIVWDGKNLDGDKVLPGIYIYTYISPEEKGTGKFTLIR